MTTLVFAHGWGFDHRLWDGVRLRLALAHRVDTVDLGFFGEPRMPMLAKVGDGETVALDATLADSGPVIAVGHSLGACWWLTQSPIAWQRLLIINGFPRFTEYDGFAPAVAPRVLSRMQTQFAREPAKVLADFRARCNATSVSGKADSPDIARLADGLQWLAEWDGRAMLADRIADVHVLAGAADPIVPRAMTEMAFAALPAERLHWSDAPGHVLPLTAPDVCAHWIEGLIHE